jgi:hypothetical protein
VDILNARTLSGEEVSQGAHGHQVWVTQLKQRAGHSIPPPPYPTNQSNLKHIQQFEEIYFFLSNKFLVLLQFNKNEHEPVYMNGKKHSISVIVSNFHDNGIQNYFFSFFSSFASLARLR